MSYLYNVPCCLWPRTRQLHFVALLAVAVPCGQKSYPVARVQEDATTALCRPAGTWQYGALRY